MEAYSLDLRERICAACDEGIETHQEVAERLMAYGVAGSCSATSSTVRRAEF